jgi:myo-inositol-1(or 4)-monophosphatase
VSVALKPAAPYRRPQMTNRESHPAVLARAREALPILVDAAREAGEIALADFREGATTVARVDYKDGGSPVTEADLRVDAFLKQRLGAAFPEAGWLSEETADDHARLEHAETIVVDPIDGTRGYISGDPRWTVALALVVDGRPVAGVVHAPALKKTFAAALGQGATLNGAPISVSARQTIASARVGGPKPLVAAVAEKAGVEFVTEPKIPSLAYRLARVSEGSLDAAIASRNSHDWDIAAADIVLSEAGAALQDASGKPLSYNRRSSRRDSLVAAPLALVGALAAALSAAVAGSESGRHET